MKTIIVNRELNTTDLINKVNSIINKDKSKKYYIMVFGSTQMLEKMQNELCGIMESVLHKGYILNYGCERYISDFITGIDKRAMVAYNVHFNKEKQYKTQEDIDESSVITTDGEFIKDTDPSAVSINIYLGLKQLKKKFTYTEITKIISKIKKNKLKEIPEYIDMGMDVGTQETYDHPQYGSQLIPGMDIENLDFESKIDNNVVMLVCGKDDMEAYMKQWLEYRQNRFEFQFKTMYQKIIKEHPQNKKFIDDIRELEIFTHGIYEVVRTKKSYSYSNDKNFMEKYLWTGNEYIPTNGTPVKYETKINEYQEEIDRWIGLRNTEFNNLIGQYKSFELPEDYSGDLNKLEYLLEREIFNHNSQFNGRPDPVMKKLMFDIHFLDESKETDLNAKQKIMQQKGDLLKEFDKLWYDPDTGLEGPHMTRYPGEHELLNVALMFSKHMTWLWDNIYSKDIFNEGVIDFDTFKQACYKVAKFDHTDVYDYKLFEFPENIVNLKYTIAKYEIDIAINQTQIIILNRYDFVKKIKKDFVDRQLEYEYEFMAKKENKVNFTWGTTPEERKDFARTYANLDEECTDVYININAKIIKNGTDLNIMEIPMYWESNDINTKENIILYTQKLLEQNKDLFAKFDETIVKNSMQIDLTTPTRKNDKTIKSWSWKKPSEEYYTDTLKLPNVSFNLDTGA